MLLRNLLREDRDYTKNKLLWATLRDLDEGGEWLRNRASKYIPRRTGEPDDTYQERLAAFTYTPVMSTAIRELCDRLTSSPLYKTGCEGKFWEDWEELASPGSAPLSEKEFIVQSCQTAALYGTCYWAITLPGEVPESLAEEEEYKLYAKARILNPLDVVRTTRDGYVTAELIEVEEELVGDFITTLRVTLWGHQDTTIYEIPIKLSPLGEIEGVYLADDTVSRWSLELPVEQEPLVVPHGLGKPLLVPFTLPSNQHIGKVVYLKQLQHLRVDSGYSYTAGQAGSIQKIYTPPALPPMDDPRVVYEEPDYSKYNFDGSKTLIGGGFSFVELKGESLAAQAASLDRIEQQIYALVSKTFASGAKGYLEQSGMSKAIDQIAFNDALKAFGIAFKGSYKRLLTTLAKVSGLAEDIGLTGFEDYTQDSLDEMLEKSEKILTLSEAISNKALTLWFDRLQKVMHPGLPKDLAEEMSEGLPDWQEEEATPEDIKALADSLGLTEEEVIAALKVQGNP
jgi:hypothetical protein